MKAPEEYDLHVEFTVTDDIDERRQEAWIESYDSEEHSREDITTTMQEFLNIEIADKTEWDEVEVTNMKLDIQYNE